MTSTGFAFGTPQATAQPQQQQTPSLFATPVATPSFGTGTLTSTPSLFGAAATTTATGTGFSFSTPASTQSLGGIAPTTSTPATGFSFGNTIAPAPATGAVASTAVPTTNTTAPPSSAGGLGGKPPSAIGPQVSSLALGTDPTTGWSSRNDNRAVQELPVPPEIMALVEDLKTRMKNHKAIMVELSRASEFDVDSVGDQIEEVRSNIQSLWNMMHKQEHQCASLITDMKELGKDIDLLAQARDVPAAYGPGGSSSLLLNFLFDLVNKYAKRMMGYKVEIERAEISLSTIVATYSINAKDLWTSLTATKDNITYLSAQIQELHESLRNELAVHKNVSQVLYGAPPKPWLSNAMSGSEAYETTPPLDKVLSTTAAKPSSSTAQLENIFYRTSSMLGNIAAYDRETGAADGMETLIRSPGRGLQPYLELCASVSPNSLKRPKK